MQCSTCGEEAELDRDERCMSCAIWKYIQSVCRGVKRETAGALQMMAENGRCRLVVVKNEERWCVIEEMSSFAIVIKCRVCREEMEFRGKPNVVTTQANCVTMCGRCESGK